MFRPSSPISCILRLTARCRKTQHRSRFPYIHSTIVSKWVDNFYSIDPQLVTLQAKPHPTQPCAVKGERIACIWQGTVSLKPPRCGLVLVSRRATLTIRPLIHRESYIVQLRSAPQTNSRDSSRHLFPSHWGNSISTALRVVSLDQNPIYQALSYIWGDATITQPILPDGFDFQDTTNLASALRRLRLASESRAL